MKKTLSPGLHRISKEDYHADPCARPSLSASIAHMLVTRSPSHAWDAHPKGGGRGKEPTEAMNHGALIDSLLLGGDTEVVESPFDEYRTKEARSWRDVVLASGKLPVKADDMAAARTAVAAIRTKLAERGIILDGEHQVTAIWEESGVLCRARLDHWAADRATIYDIKTTWNAHPAAVARTMVSYGHAIQHAAYVRAIETLVPEMAGRVRMVFLCLETEPPYEPLIAHPDGSMRAIGENHWRNAVRTWGACLEVGKFPGYCQGEVEIPAPPWALTELESSLQGGSQNVPF